MAKFQSETQESAWRWKFGNDHHPVTFFFFFALEHSIRIMILYYITQEEGKKEHWTKEGILENNHLVG